MKQTLISSSSDRAVTFMKIPFALLDIPTESSVSRHHLANAHIELELVKQGEKIKVYHSITTSHPSSQKASLSDNEETQLFENNIEKLKEAYRFVRDSLSDDCNFEFVNPPDEYKNNLFANRLLTSPGENPMLEIEKKYASNPKKDYSMSNTPTSSWSKNPFVRRGLSYVVSTKEQNEEVKQKLQEILTVLVNKENLTPSEKHEFEALKALVHKYLCTVDYSSIDDIIRQSVLIRQVEQRLGLFNTHSCKSAKDRMGVHRIVHEAAQAEGLLDDYIKNFSDYKEKEQKETVSDEITSHLIEELKNSFFSDQMIATVSRSFFSSHHQAIASNNAL
jgi:flagellar motor component MotA